MFLCFERSVCLLLSLTRWMLGLNALCTGTIVSGFEMLQFLMLMLLLFSSSMTATTTAVVASYVNFFFHFFWKRIDRRIALWFSFKYLALGTCIHFIIPIDTFESSAIDCPHHFHRNIVVSAKYYWFVIAVPLLSLDYYFLTVLAAIHMDHLLYRLYSFYYCVRCYYYFVCRFLWRYDRRLWLMVHRSMIGTVCDMAMVENFDFFALDLLLNVNFLLFHVLILPWLTRHSPVYWAFWC